MDTMLDKRLADKQERMKFLFSDASTLIHDIVQPLYSVKRRKRYPTIDRKVEVSKVKSPELESRLNDLHTKVDSFSLNLFCQNSARN